jgi:hypothetical protein
MTGLATLIRGRFHADERPFLEAGHKVYALCAEYKQALWVGWERFTIMPGTHKLTRQPEAMEMIGVIRYLALTWGCRILEPAQQHTPDATDQERLKAIGYWVPGKNDAQSAAAHMLNWLLASQSLPPREAGILSAARSR